MRFEKDITFTLSTEIINSIKNCIKIAHPNEACGFVFGTIEEINLNGKMDEMIGARFFWSGVYRIDPCMSKQTTT